MEEAKIGVLMLDTTFPRLLGDIGNGLTFPFPVKYALVKGATVDRVVKEGDPSLLQPFVEGALSYRDKEFKRSRQVVGFYPFFRKRLNKK